jgi:hypothetical protein
VLYFYTDLTFDNSEDVEKAGKAPVGNYSYLYIDPSDRAETREEPNSRAIAAVTKRSCYCQLARK